MRKEKQFADLIMARLDKLEDKLDKVRTEDLPQVKIDVATLVNETSFSSKIYASIAGSLAILLSAAVSHWRR
jgi:F420-dependent methylenetetrahydromethanopterin dehydrogenase